MTDATLDAAPHAAPLDAEGRVDSDVPCVKCGYNLRMQPADGNCPECAEPVGSSTRGHYLCFAPAHWVRRVSRGLRSMWMGGIAIIALFVVQVFGLTLLMPLGMSSNSAFLDLALWGFVAVSMTLFVVVLVGAVHATTREPAELGKPERLSTRRVTRHGLWVAAALLALAVLVFNVLPPGGPGVSMWLAVISLCIAITVCMAVWPWAALRHVATLLRRVPRRGLERTARILSWVTLVSGSLLVVGYGGSALWGLGIATATTMTASAPTTAARLQALGYLPTTAPASSMVTTTTAATATPPPISSLGYVGQPTATVTTVGPTGTAITTTMPVATRGMGVIMVLSVFVSMAGCVWLPVIIGDGVVLLLAQRAVARAADPAWRERGPGA